MKGFYSGSTNSSVNSNSPKLNHKNDTVSPITSPTESILMRYLRSGSPIDLDQCSIASKNRKIVNYYKSSSSSGTTKSQLSNVDHNLKDDVLVMDGILVDSTNSGSKSVGKVRWSKNLDSSVICGSNLYKTEFCLPWEKENTQAYRYSHQFQLARGKEGKRSNIRLRNKIIDASDYEPYNDYSPPSTPRTPISTKYRSPQSSTTNSTLGRISTPSLAEEFDFDFTQDLTLQSKDAHSLAVVNPNLFGIDWSPLDDGIAVKLPNNETPSRNEVDEYTHSVLYGPTNKDTSSYVLLVD